MERALTVKAPDQLTELRPNQARYIAAITERAGACTVNQALEDAGSSRGALWRWRGDEAFRALEVRTWQHAIFDGVPTATKTVHTLLEAHVLHGKAGLAEAGRMSRWLLEGTGIVRSATQDAPRALRASLHLHAPLPATTSTSLVGSATTLDSDEWSATTVEPASALPSPQLPPRVKAPRAGGSGYLPEQPKRGRRSRSAAAPKTGSGGK